MIAHSRQSLDNREIQQQAARALDKGLITPEVYQRTREAYPFKLYSPNVFIRIGLFLLTTLAVACGLGLSQLITGGAGGLMIIWGLVCYGALELIIRSHHLYRAGIDDALLWMAILLLYYGITWFAPGFSDTKASGLVLLLATWGMLRFMDRLMALVAYGALISLLYHCLVTHGPFGILVIPLVFMIVSVVAYLLFRRFSARESARHYHACLQVLEVAALLSFYLSGNYYMVQHLNPALPDESTPVALGWFWWAFTCIVPVSYIVAAITKKDALVLWTGLPLVAASIFTVRYYYHVLPAELAMIIAGGILLAGAYTLTRYLRIPKKGFTSARPDEPHLLEKPAIEGLIAAGTFKTATSQPVNQPGGFGGGSGGGAGAGGSY